MNRPSALTVALLFAWVPTGCSERASSQAEPCAQTRGALRACPGPFVVQGIDVSAYQGTIIWPEVKNAGKAFAIARISDGLRFVDSDFMRNWQGMKSAGLVRGSYQFFRAGEDPAAQARLVATSLEGAGGLSRDDLPVVMDIETADGQPPAVVRAHMATWLAAVTQVTGRAPIIYTNFDTSTVVGPGFGSYRLWVANWGTLCPTMPVGWSAWLFWQYSDRGAVRGIAGTVDEDEFAGSAFQLASYGSFAAVAGGGDQEGGIAQADAAGGVDAADSRGANRTEGDAALILPARPGARAAFGMGLAMGASPIDGTASQGACDR